MLLTLLDAATKASSMVDIPKIIDKLVEWGINVGKDLIGAILIYIISQPASPIVNIQLAVNINHFIFSISSKLLSETI